MIELIAPSHAETTPTQTVEFEGSAGPESLLKEDFDLGELRNFHESELEKSSAGSQEVAAAIKEFTRDAETAKTEELLSDIPVPPPVEIQAIDNETAATKEKFGWLHKAIRFFMEEPQKKEVIAEVMAEEESSHEAVLPAAAEAEAPAPLETPVPARVHLDIIPRPVPRQIPAQEVEEVPVEVVVAEEPIEPEIAPQEQPEEPARPQVETPAPNPSLGLEIEKKLQPAIDTAFDQLEGLGVPLSSLPREIRGNITLSAIEQLSEAPESAIESVDNNEQPKLTVETTLYSNATPEQHYAAQVREFARLLVILVCTGNSELPANATDATEQATFTYSGAESASVLAAIDDQLAMVVIAHALTRRKDDLEGFAQEVKTDLQELHTTATVHVDGQSWETGSELKATRTLDSDGAKTVSITISQPANEGQHGSDGTAPTPAEPLQRRTEKHLAVTAA